MLVLGLSSCDDPTPRAPEKVPDPLKEVEKILGTEPKVEEIPAETELTDEGKPVIPVAEPVPDKPGFVISPYNGKWIDVTGVPPGEVMADPVYPPEEKKYFRVPEVIPPTPPEEEAPAENEGTTVLAQSN